MNELVKVGEVYPNFDGTLTVLQYVKAIKILVRHNDEYGHEMWTQADRIRKGAVRNPFSKDKNGHSFTGYGYCHTIDSKLRAVIYRLWRCVIHRTLTDSYNKHMTRNPYEDVTLCEEWYNFQVFCKFVNENKYYRRGFQLDKDLLIKGNKHYSPETCCFLPQVINGVISINYETENGLPVGVNPKYDYYEAAISYRGKRKRIGKYKTPEEASAAYVEAKEAYVKELALEWKDKIEPRAFEALMNWTVY